MKNNLILIVPALLWLTGCKNYKNNDRYELRINERVEIYYSTNSCCYYCISNENQLKHIKLVENKTIDSGPSDCEGCNYTAAFVFEGKSKGKDTLELKNLVATMNCDSNNVNSEKYIIEVK